MALLDEKTRIKYLQELGYGSVRDFQLAVMYPKWVDGIYGPQTDNALRTAWNVHLYCKDFKTKEFMCECGGRYCGAYPDYMKPSELMHIQTIRDHYGRPITITSGLRCKGWNKHLNGSVENSGHLTGLALDFYQAGVTDTVANRKASMKYIRALPNHKFSYGAYMNGTDGIYRKASYMGNAMHTECSNTTPSTPDGKLNVDGVAGGCTIVRIQTVFGISVKDGVLSGQNKSLGKYYPSVIAVQYGKGGSVTVKRLQKWAGATQDGIWGQGTSRALQHKLNSEGYNCGSADGVFGTKSMKAFQRWLNDHNSPTADTPQTTTKPTSQPTTNSSNPIIATAESLAWPKGTPESKYKYPKGSATAAFKKALDKVYPSHNKWGAGPKTGASCDVGVGTVMRYSGVDPKYPRGISEQKKHTSGNLTKLVYKNVSPLSVAKPGDAVLYTKNKSGSSNHTVIMGDGCFYEAQLKKTYFHKKTSMTKLKTKRPKVYVFRKK